MLTQDFARRNRPPVEPNKADAPGGRIISH
jgi:hypothetical protein